jgi:hypothetical protein
MFAVMKTFVTDISASTGRNDFICDMWLWHGELYSVSRGATVQVTMPKPHIKYKIFLPVEAEISVTKV